MTPRQGTQLCSFISMLDEYFYHSHSFFFFSFSVFIHFLIFFCVGEWEGILSIYPSANIYMLITM